MDARSDTLRAATSPMLTESCAEFHFCCRAIFPRRAPDKRTLEEARGNPKVPVRITSYSLEEPKKLRVHVEAGALPAALGVGKADVLVAVALDHAESHVMRGENKGRDLKHVAVAVAINKVGIVEEGKGTGAERGGLSRDVVVKLPNAAELTNLRLIAFVQKPEGGAVLGATLVGGGKTGEAEAGGKAE